MTRILLDPTELAGAASQLRGAAGEYQAIGARVASCDCGCMPPDVAAVVDSATAAIRSRLDSVAAWLSADSADLAQRAGVQQDGGFLVGAGGGGSYVTVGGDVPEFQLGGTASSGNTITIGGTDPASWGIYESPGVVGSITIGGTDPAAWGIYESTGAVGSITIGGTDPAAWGIYESPGVVGSITIGGTDPAAWGIYDATVVGGTVTIGPNFDLTDWGLGGTGYGTTTIDVGGLSGMNDAMASLVGMAVRNNDWYSFTMLQNIIASQQRAVGIWTLPDGWGYRYSSIW